MSCLIHANQSTILLLREFGKYCSLSSSISSPLVTQTLISCQICISFSWCFGSWMCKTLASTTTMSGFTFITIVAVANYWIDKVFVLKKLGFKVVPNSYLSSGRSLLPSSFKIFTDFLSTCRFGIQNHPSPISQLIIPNALTIIFGVFQ
jgi:hypothetical protein